MFCVVDTIFPRVCKSKNFRHGLLKDTQGKFLKSTHMTYAKFDSGMRRQVVGFYFNRAARSLFGGRLMACVCGLHGPSGGTFYK